MIYKKFTTDKGFEILEIIENTDGGLTYNLVTVEYHNPGEPERTITYDADVEFEFGNSGYFDNINAGDHENEFNNIKDKYLETIKAFSFFYK